MGTGYENAFGLSVVRREEIGQEAALFPLLLVPGLTCALHVPQDIPIYWGSLWVQDNPKVLVDCIHVKACSKGFHWKLAIVECGRLLQLDHPHTDIIITK